MKDMLLPIQALGSLSFFYTALFSRCIGARSFSMGGHLMVLHRR